MSIAASGPSRVALSCPGRAVSGERPAHCRDHGPLAESEPVGAAAAGHPDRPGVPRMSPESPPRTPTRAADVPPRPTTPHPAGSPAAAPPTADPTPTETATTSPQPPPSDSSRFGWTLVAVAA